MGGNEQLRSELGRKMEQVLPHQPSVIAALLRARPFTPKFVERMPDREGVELYRRSWLLRSPHMSLARSVVSLHTDYVNFDPSLNDQSNQFSRHSRVVARSNQGKVFFDSAEEPRDTELEGMILLVDGIQEAVRIEQIAEAVDVGYFPIENRLDIDSIVDPRLSDTY